MPTGAAERNRVSAEWFLAHLRGLVGGIDRSLAPEDIDESRSPNLENVIARDGILKVDTGYKKLGTNTPRGTPRKAFEYDSSAGVTNFYLITDSTFYRLSATKQWVYISDGVDTTLSAGEPQGETVLAVVDETGFSVDDYVGVTLDDGTQHQAQVDAVAANQITIDVGLAGPAASGKAVVKALDLTGNSSQAVVVAHVPSHDWTVFTNGIDTPKRFDGTTVENIPNLGNVICRTLTVYVNHLTLANLVDGGTARPYRVKWADTGDPTNWTTGNAGYEDLFDTRDPITAMLPLGQDNIIYRSRSVVRHEYVGTLTQLFNFRTMIFGESRGAVGVGAVSPNAIFAPGDSHMVLSHDGVYLYRGGFSIQPVSEQVFSGIFDAHGELDQSKVNRFFVQFVDERDEVFFFYCSLNDTYPSRALIYNIRTGAWFKRTFTREFTGGDIRFGVDEATIEELVGSIIEQEWILSGKSITGLTPVIALASADGFVYQYDYVSGNDAETDVSWFIETKDFPAVDRTQRYDWIQAHLAGINVLIQYSPDAGLSWFPLDTVSPGPARANVRIHKQFVAERIRLRFSGTGGGAELGAIAAKLREDSRWI